MATEWFKTSYPGVRFKKHPTRKHGVNHDRYFTIRYKINGKDHEEGVGWASEGVDAEHAYEKLAELKKNRRAGAGPVTLSEKRRDEGIRKEDEDRARERKRKKETTFREFWEKEYLPKATVLKKTYSMYTERGIWKNWLSQALGDTPLQDITPAMLDNIVVGALKAGKSPRTAKYIMAVVSQVWNMAYTYNVVQGENPVKRVKVPKADNRRTRFLKEEEARLLLAELAKHSLDTHDAVVISLFCGMRAGEIHALTWGDIDVVSGTILLRNTKNKRNRYVYMTEEVKALFARRRRGQPRDHYVIPDAKGKMRTSVSNIFEKVVEKLGFNQDVTDPRHKVVFHTCRHTCASWLVQRGIPLYTVGEVLGHTTLEMTKRYSHLAPEDMRRAAMRLQGLLDKPNDNVVPFKPASSDS